MKVPMPVSKEQKHQTFSRLTEIQYLRAAAAFSVVVFHASYYLAVLRGAPAFHATFDSSFGRFGVTLFFVISGFLMAGLAPRSDPTMFLVHRVVRIYPVFWIIAAVVFAIHAMEGMAPELDPLAFLLITGGPHRYVLGIEWTLPFELAFYAVIFFLIAIGLAQEKRLFPFAIAWVIVLLIVQQKWPRWMEYSSGHQFPTITYLLFSEKCYGFAMGLAIPAVVRRFKIGFQVFALGAASIGFGLLWPGYSNLLFAIGGAAMVACAANPKKPWLGREIAVLSQFGDWSFAIYLVHVPVIVWLFKTLPSSWSPGVCWAIALVTVLATGAIAGAADVRLYRWIKAQCDAAPRALAILISASFLLVFLGAGGAVDHRERQERRELLAAEQIGRRVEVAHDEIDARVRLRQAGLSESEELAGRIDMATAQLSVEGTSTIEIYGWALDRRQNGSSVAVLFFETGRFIGAAVPRMKRGDVAKQFAISADRMVGFTKSVRLTDCRNEFEAVVVSGDRFLQLPVQKASVARQEC
jgi:exopolysaccharide production protein ExoZ